MQVTVEDQSAIRKKLHIEIPEETVAKKLDDSYRQLRKNAKIKGFRPGKAPVSMLKRLYKDKVHAEVAMELIQSSLPEAVQEKSLNIIGEPDIDPPELKEEGPFAYKATVEVKPEIEDIDYSGLTLKKSLYQASQAEIDNQIEMLRKNLAEEEEITESRPAAEGDIVHIRYSASLDGASTEAFPESEDYKMIIGQGGITKEFDEQLIGLTAGEEKTFDLTLPADYDDASVAGKTVAFTVTINAIKEQVLPEVNDEMAAKLGPFKTVDQLRQEIRKHLQEGYDKRQEQEMNEQVFEALLARCEFEVPETMIEHELNGIIQEIERTYSAYNMSLEMTGQTHESLREQYRDTAIKQARRHIILNKIIEQDKLEVSDEELQAGFQEMADAMQQPVEMIKQFYQERPEQIDVLRYSLLERAAMKQIMANSTIEEVEPETADAEEAAADNA
ncbi:MAG: trigger factor [Desulfosudaceae bacterium]